MIKIMIKDHFKTYISKMRATDSSYKMMMRTLLGEKKKNISGAYVHDRCGMKGNSSHLDGEPY